MRSDDTQHVDSADFSDQSVPTVVDRRHKRWRYAGVFGILALVAGGMLWAAFGRPRMSPLTSEAIEAAEARWQENAPQSYEIEVTLSGRREGVFRVVVKDGKPTGATLNGRPTVQHAWETWTVRGQFGTLWQELENAADPAKVYGVPNKATVVARVEFDREWSYPRRFWRSVMGGNNDIAWEVTHFAILP